jgi:hypothetical protein
MDFTSLSTQKLGKKRQIRPKAFTKSVGKSLRRHHAHQATWIRRRGPQTTLTNQRWFNVYGLIVPEITLPAHFLGFLILVDSSSHFLQLWKIEPSSSRGDKMTHGTVIGIIQSYKGEPIMQCST